MTHKSRVDETQ